MLDFNVVAPVKLASSMTDCDGEESAFHSVVQTVNKAFECCICSEDQKELRALLCCKKLVCIQCLGEFPSRYNLHSCFLYCTELNGLTNLCSNSVMANVSMLYRLLLYQFSLVMVDGVIIIFHVCY